MDSCRIYFVLNFEIILNESILFFSERMHIGMIQEGRRL
ncbi:hypothetical protein CLOL250_02068 [Clostridium sp. L2-50]|nr:hypothetical protein CLOL250_02068 [Clostridium sp. L2-50]